MSRVVIVGAGAAGTMAAIFAASTGADTTLLERTRDGGRKIVISGGGRCNILPSAVDESRFVTDSSPHTLRHILRTWPLREQVRFFEDEAGLPLVEEPASAKLFPKSDSGRDVRDRLLALARARGAVVETGALVTGVTPTGDGRWRVERDSLPALDTDSVILGTGGLSVPNTGSDGLGLTLAQALGHTIRQTYAALTPLTAEGAPFARLSGVSLAVALTARAGGMSALATGGFLFTHQGYSGPSVLDVSHVAVRARMDGLDGRITAAWTALGEREWEAALRPAGVRTALSVLANHLPARLGEVLLEHAGVDVRRKLSQLTRDERTRLIAALTRMELPWSGDEGYKKAEVTGGGVDLADIDPRTMESRRHPGLFLCGEMLDAFGPIGGYNFLWAWATGRAAGLGAARRSY